MESVESLWSQMNPSSSPCRLLKELAADGLNTSVYKALLSSGQCRKPAGARKSPAKLFSNRLFAEPLPEANISSTFFNAATDRANSSFEIRDDEHLRSFLQREANTLAAGHSKAAHASSLGRLHTLFVQQDHPPCIYSRILQVALKPLTRAISHSSETCREAAAAILTRVARKAGEDVDSIMHTAIPVLVERFGSEDMDGDIRLPEVMRPAPEQKPLQLVPIERSEEVRLACIELLSALLERCSDEMVLYYINEITGILRACAMDCCSAVRLQACQLIRFFCEQNTDDLFHFTEPLARSLLSCLVHPHAKVRLHGLHAVSAVMRCGLYKYSSSIVQMIAGWQDPNIVPIKAFYEHCATHNYFASLVNDRAAVVRMFFYETLAFWIYKLEDKADYESWFFPYLISGLFDEHKYIQRVVYCLLEECGALYEKEKEKDIREIRQLDFKEPWTYQERARIPFPLGGSLSTTANTEDAKVEDMKKKKEDKDLEEAEGAMAAGGGEQERFAFEYATQTESLPGYLTGGNAVLCLLGGIHAAAKADVKRPRLGARCLVKTHFRRYVKSLFKEVDDFKEVTNERAARLLIVSLAYVESAITEWLDEFIRHCASMYSKKHLLSPKLRHLYDDLLTLAGAYVDPSSFWKLLEEALNTSCTWDISYRIPHVQVLSQLLRGTVDALTSVNDPSLGAGRLTPILNSLCSALSASDLLVDAAASGASEPIKQVVDSLLQSSYVLQSLSSESRADLFFVILVLGSQTAADSSLQDENLSVSDRSESSSVTSKDFQCMLRRLVTANEADASTPLCCSCPVKNLPPSPKKSTKHTCDDSYCCCCCSMPLEDLSRYILPYLSDGFFSLPLLQHRGFVFLRALLNVCQARVPTTGGMFQSFLRSLENSNQPTQPRNIRRQTKEVAAVWICKLLNMYDAWVGGGETRGSWQPITHNQLTHKSELHKIPGNTGATQGIINEQMEHKKGDEECFCEERRKISVENSEITQSEESLTQQNTGPAGQQQECKLSRTKLETKTRETETEEIPDTNEDKRLDRPQKDNRDEDAREQDILKQAKQIFSLLLLPRLNVSRQPATEINDVLRVLGIILVTPSSYEATKSLGKRRLLQVFLLQSELPEALGGIVTESNLHTKLFQQNLEALRLSCEHKYRHLPDKDWLDEVPITKRRDMRLHAIDNSILLKQQAAVLLCVVASTLLSREARILQEMPQVRQLFSRVIEWLILALTPPRDMNKQRNNCREASLQRRSASHSRSNVNGPSEGGSVVEACRSDACNSVDGNAAEVNTEQVQDGTEDNEEEEDCENSTTPMNNLPCLRLDTGVAFYLFTLADVLLKAVGRNAAENLGEKRSAMQTSSVVLHPDLPILPLTDEDEKKTEVIEAVDVNVLRNCRQGVLNITNESSVQALVHYGIRFLIALDTGETLEKIIVKHAGTKAEFENEVFKGIQMDDIDKAFANIRKADEGVKTRHTCMAVVTFLINLAAMFPDVVSLWHQRWSAQGHVVRAEKALAILKRSANMVDRSGKTLLTSKRRH